MLRVHVSGRRNRPVSGTSMADLMVSVVRNNLWDWQSLSPSSGGGTFFEFCDALEVKNGVSAGPRGWGLQHALQAWGKYWTETYYAGREYSPSSVYALSLTHGRIIALPVCGDNDVV